jgi:hypothetical protein
LFTSGTSFAHPMVPRNRCGTWVPVTRKGCTILYTSYYLAEKAGATNDCEGYRAVKAAIGGEPTEGIALTTVLQYAGLKDALWCLRAVHPEQKTIATRASRVWVVRAAQTAIGLYHTEVDSFHRNCLEVASDRIHGLVDRYLVDKARKEIWTEIPQMMDSRKWIGWLLWLALGDTQKNAHHAWDTYRENMVTKVGGGLPHMAMMHEAFIRAVQGPLLNCVGPGTYNPSSDAATPVVSDGIRIKRRYIRRQHYSHRNKANGIQS